MKKNMRYTGLLRIFILAMLMTMATAVSAQITSVRGTLSDDMGPLMGATVCESDAT